MARIADPDRSEPFSFGRWRFDAETGDLCDGQATTRLEPRVARLLDHFLRHQDALISRDELIAAVWDNRVVSDDAINRCISILRQLLTPEDRYAFVETVVRRGFISHFPPPPEPESAPLRLPHASYRTLALLATLAAVIALAVFRLLPSSPAPAPESKRERTPVVAVLPFLSAGPTEESAFFANGMHDDLLTQLAQMQSLKVISRTSVLEYRDGSRNLREIGRDLGVDAILEGGVQRVGDQIRINVQLIDARADVHLWARQYDRDLTPANIFGIQTEIARSIASAMDSTLTRQDVTQLDVLPTDNMAAYRAYHRAVELRNTETIRAPEYVAALGEAVRLDPAFVRAWAELAGSLSYANYNRQDSSAILRLEKILARIGALAPQSAELLIAQTYYTYYIVKDHDLAFRLIEQARELTPNDPQVLDLRSWIQRRLGDFDGMVESIRLALSLDPRNPYWIDRMATGLVVTHRYDEAMEVLESAPVESFRLSFLRSLLRVRDHREPGRLLDDLRAMQREFDVAADPIDRWEAHLAARDFDGAAALLDAMQATDASADAWKVFDLPDLDLARAITDRFQGTGDAGRSSLDHARSSLARKGEPGMRGFGPNFYLVMAHITALEGDQAETERLVRHWLREAERDLAERFALRHRACRALGLAAAATAAVGCLRYGFTEPSLLLPFVEPFLPYYDPIRDAPEFVDLLAEIQSK